MFTVYAEDTNMSTVKENERSAHAVHILFIGNNYRK